MSRNIIPELVSLLKGNVSFDEKTETWIVKGDVDFSGMPILTLPPHTRFTGNVSIRGSLVRGLSEGLVFDRSFDMSHTGISEWTDTVVGENVYMGCTQVSTLPSNPHVGGKIFPNTNVRLVRPSIDPEIKAFGNLPSSSEGKFIALLFGQTALQITPGMISAPDVRVPSAAATCVDDCKLRY
jgi:hypothetical protein